MRGKRICSVVLLCLLLASCADKGVETPEDTQAVLPSGTSQPTGTVNPTNPTQETPGDSNTPTKDTTPTVPPTEYVIPDDTEKPSSLATGCYDNSANKLSVAFMEDGTVYFMDREGYWKGEFYFEEPEIVLVFEYKTERGYFDSEGRLILKGHGGDFQAAGKSNGYGPALSMILGGESITGTVPALAGSWYNETTQSTLVFHEGGSIYHVLPMAVMEGDCRRQGDGYLLRFSFGGKVFGPYATYINSEGHLVLDGQDGVYIKK